MQRDEHLPRKHHPRGRGLWPTLLSLGVIGCATPFMLGLEDDGGGGGSGGYVVFAQNDLGMHCMQRDYEHLMVLPPFNTAHAWIIERRDEPRIIEQLPAGQSLSIHIPSNTRSADKTNWWRYEQALLGQSSPPNVGLVGNGLAGDFAEGSGGTFEFVGMPLTPLDDAGRNNPYQLATVEYKSGGTVLASTQTVIPVSWELRCDLCHGDPTPGMDTDLDILRDHDKLHQTDLINNQPVACSSCHADPALGAPGDPNLPSFSSAMHTAHADRLVDLPVELVTDCYACHPGQRAQCQRDVHLTKGMNCEDCHGQMADVGNPARTPWVTEPRCADCHNRAGFDFEPAGVLFRDAKGHGGVACVVCHGGPHGITPAVTDADNIQPMRVQGHPGTIDTCTVCHTQQPDDNFFHSRDD